MTTVYILLALAAGFCAALKLVGYGVRQGMEQIYRLWRYRTGRCHCGLCEAKETRYIYPDASRPDYKFELGQPIQIKLKASAHTKGE